MLRFAKYESIGNDFIVIDRRGGGEDLSSRVVRTLCHRHTGIGADGVLTLWSDPDPQIVGRMQVQNADGSDASMCGNGLRCMARFLYDTAGAQPAAPRQRLRVGGRVVLCTRLRPARYRVDIGQALFAHEELPSPEPLSPDSVAISAGGRRFTATAVWVGNPHVVIFCDGEDPLLLAEEYGGLVESHALFPNRVNVSFVRPRTGAFDVVVFERGVGLTRACTSAAAAVAAAATRQGRLEVGDSTQVCLPGGTLVVEMDALSKVSVEGEAQRVFSGETELTT